MNKLQSANRPELTEFLMFQQIDNKPSSLLKKIV